MMAANKADWVVLRGAIGVFAICLLIGGILLRLFESGILGQEHRLSWIEALRNAGDAIMLPDVDYRISSQSVYEAPFPVSLGAFDIYFSEMNLTLGLLHEGDLMNMLTALDEQADGLYSVSRCEGVRASENDVKDSTRPKIMVDCILNWYTVDLKGERELTL
jgi:hypothetical protein